MLFLVIFDYAPGNRDKLMDKYIKKGPMLPEGFKVVGMWSSIGGGRVCSVYETNDPEALAKFGHEWNDLGKSEVIPIMETAEYIKSVRSDDFKEGS